MESDMDIFSLHKILNIYRLRVARDYVVCLFIDWLVWFGLFLLTRVSPSRVTERAPKGVIDLSQAMTLDYDM